jgi:hypothetical protein
VQEVPVSKQQQAVAATLSALNQRAMEIVKLPADEREVRYKVCRQRQYSLF